MCKGGAAKLIGSETITSCLLWFHVVRSSVDELGMTWYSSSDPLASSSVNSSYSRAFSFPAAAFLDGVADVPPRFGLYFSGIVDAGKILVIITMN